MQLEDIRREVSQDIDLSKGNLDAEQRRTPLLHDKYLRYFLDETKELRRMDRGYAILLKKKTEYYLGKADDETYKQQPFNLKVRPIKSDLNLYLNADPDIQRAQELMTDQELKVKYLESTVKRIANRSYEIHNAIEWNKFQFGLDTIKVTPPEDE